MSPFILEFFMKQRQSPFPIRIDLELLDFIKQEAKKQGRSTSKQIEFLLKGKVRSLKEEKILEI